jgi:hypothetical protein
LLNDPAPQTWREFFTPWIEAAGLAPEKVKEAAAFVPARGLRARFEGVRTHSLIQKIAPKIPGVLKRSIKALISAMPEPPAPDAFSGLSAHAAGPAPLSQEMTALQRCQWRFPTDPGATRLGWKPLVDWAAAVDRTLAWLRFADLLPVAVNENKRT